MRLSPTVLTDRLRAVTDRLARGSAVPAGTDPEEAGVPKPAGSRERGAMRRRLRQLRKLRDAHLMELGALVLEAHRRGRDDAGVIKAKAAEVAGIDAEAHALADTLGAGGELDRLLTTGVAGPCPSCGTLVSTWARFCERCGTDLSARPEPAEAVWPDAAEADPAAESEAAAEWPESDAPATQTGQPVSENGDGSEPTAVIEPEQETTR